MVRTRPLAVLVFATGCTQVLGIPEIHRACNADAAFGAAAPVGGLDGDLGEQTAQLTPDELTVVFSRQTLAEGPDGGESRYGDLYVAHRDHLRDEFGAATPLTDLNTELDEHGASFTADQRTVYFDRGLPTRRYQIWTAVRTPDGRFGPAVPFPLVDDTSSVLEPYVTPNAFFFALRHDDGSASLFTAPSRGVLFATPQRLETLETLPGPPAYRNPVVTLDGLTIYFSAPPDNASQADIWTASRTGADQPFGAPHAVAELNSISADRPAWISQDRCRLYFMTNRTGQGLRLWMASRVGL